jgi:hypothetical protein
MRRLILGSVAATALVLSIGAASAQSQRDEDGAARRLGDATTTPAYFLRHGFGIIISAMVRGRASSCRLMVSISVNSALTRDALRRDSKVINSPRIIRTSSLGALRSCALCGSRNCRATLSAQT